MKHSHDLDLTGLSARNRRYMALGIRGGDGDEPTPVEALLSRVEAHADLTDEDLVALHDELATAFTEALEARTDEGLALAQTLRDAIHTTRDTYLARAAHDEDLAAEADRLRAEVFGEVAPEGEGETPPEAELNADGTPVEVPEPVADGNEPPVPAELNADGTPIETPEPLAAGAGAPIPTPAAGAAGTRIESVNARRPAATRPRVPAQSGALSLRASANLPGVPAGSDLTRPENLADAVGQMITASQGYRGARTKFSIARLGSQRVEGPYDVFGPERMLTRDAQENQRKVDAFVDFHRPEARESLRAAGGNCAPPQVQYDFVVMGTDQRPFRDTALARFGADRGGVRTFPPAKLSDVAGAVDVWTQANDIDPGSDGPETKTCITMTCPDETETLVDAITRCLTIGNFRQRFFPEQIQMWMTKVAQYQARYAETRAMTQVGAGSTNVSAGTVLGTTRDVLAVLDRASAAMRSRHRLPPDFPLRCAFPDWLLDNMRVDLSREQPGSTDERLAMSEAQIEAFFAVRNINMTWFLDGESGQIFGNQSAGALLAWPSHVIGYLYPEGSWLHVDGGIIDFGIVRDSVTNSTNDFQWFAETLEQTHFNGYESLRLDIDICPNGATALPTAITPCTIGS